MEEEYKTYIVRYICLLKEGVDFEFAVLPSVSRLFNRLKAGGFIAEDTTEGCFKILFGIPINRQNEEFRKIVWKRDLQLLRYLLYRIIKFETWQIPSIAYQVFLSKSNKPANLPKPDKKRLEGAYGIDELKEIIDEFLYGTNIE